MSIRSPCVKGLPFVVVARVGRYPNLVGPRLFDGSIGAVHLGFAISMSIVLGEIGGMPARNGPGKSKSKQSTCRGVTVPGSRARFSINMASHNGLEG
jgi:hypothetical protein